MSGQVGNNERPQEGKITTFAVVYFVPFEGHEVLKEFPTREEAEAFKAELKAKRPGQILVVTDTEAPGICPFCGKESEKQ